MEYLATATLIAFAILILQRNKIAKLESRLNEVDATLWQTVGLADKYLNQLNQQSFQHALAIDGLIKVQVATRRALVLPDLPTQDQLAEVDLTKTYQAAQTK